MAKKEKKVKEPKQKKNKQPKAPNMPKKPGKERNVANVANRIVGNPIRVMAVAAVVSLVLGVALFKFYADFKDYFDFIIGGVIAVIGVISIMSYFIKPMAGEIYRSEFAIGMICIGLGIYVAAKSGVSISLLAVIGVLVLVDAIFKMQYTLDLVRTHFKAWWVVAIFSLLSLFIGLVTIMNLLKDVIEQDNYSVTGLALCANALFDIVVLIVIAIRNHKLAKNPVVEETPITVDVFEDTEINPEEISMDSLLTVSEEVVADGPATDETVALESVVEESAAETISEVPVVEEIPVVEAPVEETVEAEVEPVSEQATEFTTAE